VALAIAQREAILCGCPLFSFLGQQHRKKGLPGGGRFWQDLGLAVLPIFIAMKPKRSVKKPVPLGVIWWKEQKRHPLNVYVGKVVRRLRTGRGWALEDLALAAGVAKSYVCQLERGLDSPTLEVQLRLEAALGLVDGGLVRLAHREMRRAG
jgi:DNA-binding XRE family transcriptional regulator